MTDGDWLDEQQQRAWVGMRAVGALLDTALDRQLQRDAGISHATYLVLSVLSEMPDRTLTMTQLAQLTNSSQSRLSHAVTRLEEDGWVTRSRCGENRRVVYAELTDAGFEVVKAAAPGHVAKVKQLVFDNLSPAEVKHLMTVNGLILRALGDDGFPALAPLNRFDLAAPPDEPASATG